MFPKECESFPSLWRFSKAAYTSRLQMFYNAQRLKTWKEKTEWHYCPLLCLPIVWWSLTFSHFVAAWMNQAVKTDMSQDIIENIISLFFQYCLQFLNFLWLHLFICNTTNGKLEFFFYLVLMSAWRVKGGHIWIIFFVHQSISWSISSWSLF